MPKDGKVEVPNVYIHEIAKRKLDAYTKHAVGEISGLGIVELKESGLYINDLFILEQEATSSDTELDPAAISRLIADLIAKGDNPATLKLWWHSHVDMGVFWSGTDTGTIDGFSNEYMVSIVTNKKQDYLARIDLYEPFRISIDEVPILVLRDPDNEFDEAIKKEIREKVKSKIYGFSRETNGYLGYDDLDMWPDYQKHGIYNGRYNTSPKLKDSRVGFDTGIDYTVDEEEIIMRKNYDFGGKGKEDDGLTEEEKKASADPFFNSSKGVGGI